MRSATADPSRSARGQQRPESLAPQRALSVRAAHNQRLGPPALEPTGRGVDWMAQLLPFQRSASVRWLLVPMNQPTAVHALGEVHDTGQVRWRWRWRGHGLDAP